MAKKRYSPKVKFQVVLEALTGEKTPGQIAKQYGIHPNSVGLWKKEFLDRGAELFAEDGTVQEYERRIRQLEQLVGKKEVEIALLKLLGPGRMSSERKVELADRARSVFGLTPALAALELPRSTWHYHHSCRRSYTEKYADLRAPLEAIARRHPEYGYRRTTPELRERTGRRINRKVVQRLHRAWGLPLIRGTRMPKPSGIRRAITAAGTRDQPGGWPARDPASGGGLH